MFILQIDFKMQVNITGIATKGYKDEWFKSYNIRYYDGSYWYPLRETEFPFLPKVGNNNLIYTSLKKVFRKSIRVSHCCGVCEIMKGLKEIVSDHVGNL